jgi:Rad3-related DNA helicase
VSEGINFADEHARAVVMIGIPFPPAFDLKVKQKKAFNNDRNNQARGLITGDAWYTLQAYRSMNQVWCTQQLNTGHLMQRLNAAYCCTASPSS